MDAKVEGTCHELGTIELVSTYPENGSLNLRFKTKLAVSSDAHRRLKNLASNVPEISAVIKIDAPKEEIEEDKQGNKGKRAKEVKEPTKLPDVFALVMTTGTTPDQAIAAAINYIARVVKHLDLVYKNENAAQTALASYADIGDTSTWGDSN